ncbi:DUF3397 domain-containing protein [Fictibacillus aquaticus]|uniref:DUF3397 domain-containing protein n=1 Tax=Fictibacillus aquaticus TaxID=2021314 RepID=A0A235FDD7_9BACL|nr:DUF3397 domain-containing protein [Fictibacillus aquaticus]OYD58953.1 hypothetical protein CGZ90_03360 [Fictibacillus aquaticus]
MATFTGGVLGIFAAAPFLMYFLVYVSFKRQTRKLRKSAVIARDVTTFTLFFSVHRLTEVIFNEPFYWALALIFLSGCIGVSVVLWKLEKEITFGKLMKINWRLQFLLMSAAYAGLIVFGIYDRILSA